jgi:pimeloyl-ACP methyl ester carboxylesterase
MARFESVTGKYVYLDVQGIEYRVYFEENGRGIPLVCQHTAGSDGRQWRHLMNDNDVTSTYRVIAFDLPFHGKSLPPESREWWKEEYLLHKAFLFDFHEGFIRALGLDRPVYIGCSMGGHLAPDLALERPELYRAVIGVEGSMRSPEDPIRPWLYHPKISNDYRVHAMMAMMGPQSPEKYRRETVWEYGQSGPMVFRGDLNYYFAEHDLTGRAHEIDTSRVGVYLMAGEYDAAVSPEDGQALADAIKGATFTALKGLGHFGVCENYELFKTYLIPILKEIAAKG